MGEVHGVLSHRGRVVPPLSKRYAPSVACARKVKYATWAEAEEVCRIHAQRDHSLVFAHHCDWCDGWHNAKPVSAMRSSVDDPIRTHLMLALKKGEA